MDNAIIDEFIKKTLDVLPIDGLEKLNNMIDNDEITEESLYGLLKEYQINPVDIIKDINGRK